MANQISISRWAITMICLVSIGYISITMPAAAEMRLVILGTGTPNPDPGRFGPSVAIVTQGQAYLIDSGVGIVRRAAAAAKQGMPELEAKNLNLAFLTHLHSDHTMGLADLIFTPWILTRKKPLSLYGPLGTKHMADSLIQAYDQDIQMRLHGSQPANPEGYKVLSTEIQKPGVIFEDAVVRVEAVPVIHGSWHQAFGYKFTEKSPQGNGRVIVVSGDATFSPALIEAAMGADLLVHEVFSTAGLQTRPEAWRRYHRSFHTSTKQLAEIANKVKPKQLVMYHQLQWGVSNAALVAEIRQAGYQGSVASAEDLDVY